jgi:hypothetical protein
MSPRRSDRQEPRWLFALLLPMLFCACSAGRQALGYERDEGDDAGAGSADGSTADFSADTQLPWFGGPAYHARWPNGLSASMSYVPIGVWMQNPENAIRYRDLGVNLFIGLWEGPTDAQLDALPAPDVHTFCGQSGVWQSRLDDRAISGWMQDDSPDNAQELPEGGYGPCIDPSVVQERNAQMTAADRSRPTFLLLGQGVADSAWVGRGDCTGRTEMYRDYAEGADVLGFHVYPRARGDLQLNVIATGVDNLLAWSSHQKPVLALIEASNIDGNARPSPEDIRAEVWLALVRGAAGVAYFCHRFMPDFSETDCLDDAPTRTALARINREITMLAPALNSPMVGNGVAVDSDVPVATRLARVAGVTYLFAVALDDAATSARFSLRGIDAGLAEVIGEDRTLEVEGGVLGDDFDGYGVHVYRIRPE